MGFGTLQQQRVACRVQGRHDLKQPSESGDDVLRNKAKTTLGTKWKKLLSSWCKLLLWSNRETVTFEKNNL